MKAYNHLYVISCDKLNLSLIGRLSIARISGLQRWSLFIWKKVSTQYSKVASTLIKHEFTLNRYYFQYLKQTKLLKLIFLGTFMVLKESLRRPILQKHARVLRSNFRYSIRNNFSAATFLSIVKLVLSRQ